MGEAVLLESGCNVGCEILAVTGLGGGGKEGGGGGEITLSEYGRGLGGGRRFLAGFGGLPGLGFSVDEVRESSVSDLELFTYRSSQREKKKEGSMSQ